MKTLAHRCPACRSALVTQSTKYICVHPFCSTVVEMPLKADVVARTAADQELTEGEVRHALAALRQVDRKASAAAAKLTYPSHTKMLDSFIKKLTVLHQALFNQKQATTAPAEGEEPLDGFAKRRKAIVEKMRRQEISAEEADRQFAELARKEESQV